jgi:hypothetical protein
MDTIIGNLTSLGTGVLTFLAKNGWDYLVKKLQKKTDLNPDIEDLPKTDYGNSKDNLKLNTELINEQ